MKDDGDVVINQTEKVLITFDNIHGEEEIDPLTILSGYRKDRLVCFQDFTARNDLTNKKNSNIQRNEGMGSMLEITQRDIKLFQVPNLCKKS